MKETYFIYSIEDRAFDGTNVKALFATEYSSPFGYNTREEALQWIEEQGAKNCSYVILQEFKKV